jgi:hypothetical protein
MDARHDVGDLPRPARAQAARAMMRVVPKSGHRVKHPGFSRLAYPAAAVKHIRDGLPGYPGGLGHVLDRYLPRGQWFGLA